MSGGGFAPAVLQAVVDEARAAIGARTAVLVALGGDALRVAAAAGPVDPALVVGGSLPARGARGYVLASGQPTALSPAATDESNAGAGGARGVPATLLVAPGGDGTVLELADRSGGPFTIEDVELATSFAAVAGAALRSAPTAVEEVLPPARLAAELAALADTAPDRYRDVARAVEALLALGR